MRVAIVILMVLISVNVTFAADLGSSRLIVKKTIPVWSGLAVEGEKIQCGEDKANACELEFGIVNEGTTEEMGNNYDVACPYTGSFAPEYVFYYIPGSDQEVSVDLCANGADEGTFDTKVYVVRDSDDETIACNDDFYSDGHCGENASYISSVQLAAGEKYYIIVDGYGFDEGPFYLTVDDVVSPPDCDVIGPNGAYEEGEPAVGGLDTYNSGCALENGMPPFQELLANSNLGVLTFSGHSGWYSDGDTQYRDTDWFTAIFDDMGLITWEVTAEERMTMYRLTTGDCDDVHVISQATVIPCETQRLVLNGEPGDVAWLWLGPESYDPPADYLDEFDYVMVLEGLYGVFDPTSPVEASTWGSLKAMYR